MTARIIDIYSGLAQEPVMVEIPDDAGHEHPGSWHGNIRARAHDDDTDEWFFHVAYSIGPGKNGLDTFPVTWCRRPTANDYAGIIPAEHLERMIASGELDPD